MIAIIGGGITGLAAAYELARRGTAFTLFEASPRVGGLILTEQIDGFTIEAGPDSILTQKPAALRLCEELGLGARLIATKTPRTAFVLKRGRLYPLPSPSVLGIPTTVAGAVRYELLSWPARVRLAMEPLVPRRRGTGDESVSSFFSRRFGPSTVSLVAEPLLGGIHAGDVTALSMASLFPRLMDAEARYGSVIRAFRKLRADPDGAFRSLVGGMGELVSAIEARLPAGAVRYSSLVTALETDARRWRVLACETSTRVHAVIVATPAHTAARLLAGVNAEAASLAADVPYVSTASVTLAWPRRAVGHALAGSGFVVARRYGRERITACTWISSKWPGRAPPDTVLLRAFIGGARDPDVVNLADADIIALAARDVAKVLRISGPPILTRVHRWRDAGAQHNIGQLARVGMIEARLASRPGLFVAGSGFRAVGIPDCVADGRAIAAAAADYIKIAG